MAAVVKITVLVLAFPVCGSAAFAVSGFDYCAPPIVPACIAQVAQERSPAAVRACSPQVMDFARMLGAYRICLQRQSERAVVEGNEAIARFRCLSLGLRSCAPVAGATER